MKKSLSTKQIQKVLSKKGWEFKNQTGSHINYKHPDYKGRVTLPHPKKDLPYGTFRSILKQMNITEEDFYKSL